jgi:hypothetical protein
VSDDYSPVGLLCWFVDLKVFGCIDPEHGKVMTFPDSTWSDIVASPIAYLDERWDGTGLGENIFPWLYFPFVLEDNSETKLLPYRHQCPMHELAITTMRRPRPRIFESFRRRETASWLHNYQKTFPCSGLPINENDDQLACIACREAEDNWLREVIAAITPVDAQLYGQNWVKCPACGVRFSTVNPDSYLEDIHLRCGQRLRLQFPK